MTGDTPGPVEGGCGREGCGHDRNDHYRTQGWTEGYPSLLPKGPLGQGPCNMRGRITHCVCYEYVAPKVLTPA